MSTEPSLCRAVNSSPLTTLAHPTPTMKTLVLFLSLLTLTASQKISLKVNLAGGPVGDFLGEDQVLDMTGFSKNVVRDPIQNTDQPEVFQSQRFARSSDLTLRLPVPDGIYSVTLLFAETFRRACVAGARVFDISLGTPVSGVTKVVDKFDLFQTAGCQAAHGKRFDGVPSKDGIVVHLSQVAQHPSLAGFIVEGFPQPKGNGKEYHAIAQAQVNPATYGAAMPGAAMPGADAALGAQSPAAMGMRQGQGAPGMPGAPVPGPSGMEAPPGAFSGAQLPAGAMGPVPGAPGGFGAGRRLLSVMAHKEELVAETHDIPLVRAVGRGHSRGLKAMPVEATNLQDPDATVRD